MFVLYEGLLYLVFVLLVPIFLLLGFMRGKYLRNFPERFGRYAHAPARHDIWLHAVSVGEVMAARPVVSALLARRPELEIVFTTITITGQQQARRSFPGATVTYFPFEFSRSVRRFLRHHSPRALVVMETEIWPNVSRICAASGMPVILINGRLSDRSLPRYRAVRWFLRPVLALYRAILVREPEDRDRFVQIGADPSKIEVAGNAKFDYEPDLTPLAIEDDLRDLVAGRPVVIFGSTMEGEDEIIVRVTERLLAVRDCLVFIAPRKPERFEFVAGLLAAADLPFARRSEWEQRDPAARIILVDTIGELARLYSHATIAFIGGSLLPGTGGHNPIEAAAVGVPVLFGPCMSNFREIARTFIEAGAALEVPDGEALASTVLDLLSRESQRAQMAEKARESVTRNRGAAARMAEVILEALS